MNKYDEMKYKFANAIEFAKNVKESPMGEEVKIATLVNVSSVLHSYKVDFVNFMFEGNKDEAE